MFGTGRELHEYSDEEQELGKVYDRVLMKRLIAYLKPYRFQLVLVGFFILGNTLARLAGPYLMQRAVDENITPGQLEGLGTITILMVLALISEFVFSYFEESRTQVIGQHVMRDLRQTLFSHLQRLDVQFFDKKSGRPADDARDGRCASVERVVQFWRNYWLREPTQYRGHHGGNAALQLAIGTCDVHRHPDYLRCNAGLPDLLAACVS